MRKHLRVNVLIWLVSQAAAVQALPQQAAYDPVSAYEAESIEGFSVLINREVSAHAEEAAEARKELRRQLKEIHRVMPAGPLAALQQVKFWVEWDRKPNGAAEFHPSAQWLQNNGYNPAKAGGIEISNIRNFIKWSRAEQPCMMLHELAHAYDFQVLGKQDCGLGAAYRQAVDGGTYDEVDYIRGGKKKAYALSNEKEYFAELSEAYFGKNDFYPFTRAELEQHDPVAHAVLEKIWGKPQAAAHGAQP